MKTHCNLPKRRLIFLGFGPGPNWLECLSVEEDEASLSIFLWPVTKGGNHNITVSQTVGGMRSAHPPLMHLPGLDHLVQPRVKGVSFHIHDVDPVRSEAGNNQTGPRPRGVIIAAAASIPARVVDLISDIRKMETRNYLEMELYESQAQVQPISNLFYSDLVIGYHYA